MIDLTGRDQSWWPNLKGRTVAILASGPSMNRAICDVVQQTNWHAIAINNTWQLAPWAHTLYGCDWHWWRASDAPKAGDYRGLRVIGHMQRQGAKGFLPPEMKWQEKCLRFTPVRVGWNRLIMDGHEIGSGSNGAFQAANLAARWGAARLVLLGVDCHSPNVRWHPPHDHKEAPLPTDRTCNVWIKAWENSAPEFRRLGIEVVNASPASALRAFPRAPLADILRMEAA